MLEIQLHKALDYVDHTREKRTLFANELIENPNWIPSLLNIIEKGIDPISSKASWALECAVRKQTTIILPYIEQFTAMLHKITLNASVRPMAKICELLITAYFKNKKNAIYQALSEKHLNQIAENTFDWLIGAQKVAPKAYSMTTLFLLGTKIEWIHDELQIVLSQNFSSGSSAYKARARKILNQLKKRQKT